MARVRERREYSLRAEARELFPDELWHVEAWSGWEGDPSVTTMGLPVGDVRWQVSPATRAPSAAVPARPGGDDERHAELVARLRALNQVIETGSVPLLAVRPRYSHTWAVWYPQIAEERVLRVLRPNWS